MPFAIIAMAINVAFIVHAAKTGRFNPWGYVMLFLPGVGALAYVLLDARVREAGETGEGIIGTVFNDWLNIEGSPATLILAIVLLAMMFVAPFGIVGLLRRITRHVVVIVPRPAGRPIAETHLLTTTEAAADVEGVELEPDVDVFVDDPSTTSGEAT